MNSPLERFGRLDALRAVAIVWMVIFHCCFDLTYFGFIKQNFYSDPFWTTQRTCIVSLFLFCAGLGQAVAHEQGQSWSRFWRRWAQVVGCAALVSIGSWMMFKDRFISFGVLHGIAVMLIVVRLTAGWGRALWVASAIAIALPWFVHDPFFDSRLTNWVGLITHRPATEDYVPVLPWLGGMWCGMASGQSVLARRREMLTGAVPRGLRPLAVLGRWSLSIYMLHQPVLIGILMAVQALW